MSVIIIQCERTQMNRHRTNGEIEGHGGVLVAT